MSAIQSAEAKVRAATEAKVMTINAINDHAVLVKSTVDEPHKADWEKVRMLLQFIEIFVDVYCSFNMKNLTMCSNVLVLRCFTIPSNDESCGVLI